MATLRERLDRALSRLDSPGSSPESAGPASWLVLALVPGLALLMSGALRAALRLSITASLGLAVALLAGGVVLAALTGGLRVRRGWHVLPALLVLGTLMVAALQALHASAFDGLMSVGGGDAGNHVALRRAFVESAPDVYQQFVSFYAFTHWLDVFLGFDAFESFRAGFYAIPFLLTLCMLAALLAMTHRQEEAGVPGARVAPWLLFAGLMAATSILFPVLHYHQADGFYAHLFGLVPTLLGWVLFGFFTSRLLRIGALLFAVVLHRYTYGLNLGDVLLVSAVLAGVESTGVSHARRLQWALRALAVGLGLAALFAYWKLLPLIPVTGGIVAPRFHAMLRGQLVLSLGLLLLPLAAKRMGLALGDTGTRLARYAGLFGGVGGLVQLLCLWSVTSREYYLIKYHLHGAMLVLCATLVLVSALLAQVLSRWALRQGGAAHAGLVPLAVLVGIGVFNLRSAITPYEDSFQERRSGKAPWNLLFPLADREGWSRIQATLAREHADFGGFVSANWPLMNFMNASLRTTSDEDPLRFGWEQYTQGLVKQGPGLCVFWYATERDFQELTETQAVNGGRLLDVARALDAEAEKRCEDYPAPWDAQRPLRLCHVCEPKQSGT
ncbi:MULTISPECIES: hypothetical protein [Myxococcus]|uniref:hypothetical protein n=1 Tax=Myxococcus TaxID=32 RepID=UPI0013D0AE2B|nr:MULTISPECIES: hypothetical protein [Myxococcus]NVJ21710.1 hypothetical protein [Myxococcus sp. AM011]